MTYCVILQTTFSASSFLMTLEQSYLSQTDIANKQNCRDRPFGLRVLSNTRIDSVLPTLAAIKSIYIGHKNLKLRIRVGQRRGSYTGPPHKRDMFTKTNEHHSYKCHLSQSVIQLSNIFTSFLVSNYLCIFAQLMYFS